MRDGGLRPQWAHYAAKTGSNFCTKSYPLKTSMRHIGTKGSKPLKNSYQRFRKPFLETLNYQYKPILCDLYSKFKNFKWASLFIIPIFIMMSKFFDGVTMTNSFLIILTLWYFCFSAKKKFNLSWLVFRYYFFIFVLRDRY